MTHYGPGNYTPTEATVRSKLKTPGKLYGSDEVKAVVDILDTLRAETHKAFIADHLAINALLHAINRAMEQILADTDGGGFAYSTLRGALESHDDLAVLGYCVHGVNLDREFCPQRCRV